MTTTRYENLSSGKVFTVGMRLGGYILTDINLNSSGEGIRSLRLLKLKKDGTPDKRRKPKFVFGNDINEIL